MQVDSLMEEIQANMIFGVGKNMSDEATFETQVAAHRHKSREWNVSKQKWNLC